MSRTGKKWPKLTEQQQHLVEATDPNLIRALVYQAVPRYLIRLYGLDTWCQEAWFLVCRTAVTYDPIEYPDIPLMGYAWRVVSHQLWNRVVRYTRHQCIWKQWPEEPQSKRQMDVKDYRTKASRPVWNDTEYRSARRFLPMRHRIILYLYHIERWTYQEIGDTLSISKGRVGQICEYIFESLRKRTTTKLVHSN